MFIEENCDFLNYFVYLSFEIFKLHVPKKTQKQF